MSTGTLTGEVNQIIENGASVQEAVTSAIELQKQEILDKVTDIFPLLLGALAIIIVGAFVSIIIYKIIMFLFKKFHLIELLDKLEFDIYPEEEEKDEKGKKVTKSKRKKLSERMKIDNIIAKSFSYYIFLVFFRLSIVFIGIKEVEKFLGDLLAYLPSLFVGIVIGFFGIRFANFVYDVIYNTLELTRQKTSMIIAMGGKIIILFFTVMLVLNYIQIVDQFIINTILIGFISMLTLAGGLAFGLGGKDIAKEILESFRK